MKNSEAVLALEIMISKLPCSECGASGDESCKGSCGACLSEEDKGR